MGQERMVCSLVDNWIYDEYGGQFRLTAIVSHEHSGGKHIGFAIYVDGVKTLAFTTNYHANGSETITTMLNLGAEQKVQVAFYNMDNQNHNITIRNVRLIVELQ